MWWDCWERKCSLIPPASTQKCVAMSFKVSPATVAGNIVFNHFSCPVSYHEMMKDLKGRMKGGKDSKIPSVFMTFCSNGVGDDS